MSAADDLVSANVHRLRLGGHRRMFVGIRRMYIGFRQNPSISAADICQLCKMCAMKVWSEIAAFSCLKLLAEIGGFMNRVKITVTFGSFFII